MLWKDFREREDCEGCPLLESEICTGGYQCYGGEPIEPPCCTFDDDTDLDDWVKKYYDRLRRIEDAEDKQQKEAQKRKERAKKSADTRRAMRWYCRNEIQTLKRAQKALNAQIALENFASSWAEAVNFANEAFRYEERVQVNPSLSAEVERLKAEVETAKKAFDLKRKEFYSQRKKERLGKFEINEEV